MNHKLCYFESILTETSYHIFQAYPQKLDDCYNAPMSATVTEITSEMKVCHHTHLSDCKAMDFLSWSVLNGPLSR